MAHFASFTDFFGFTEPAPQPFGVTGGQIGPPVDPTFGFGVTGGQIGPPELPGLAPGTGLLGLGSAFAASAPILAGGFQLLGSIAQILSQAGVPENITSAISTFGLSEAFGSGGGGPQPSLKKQRDINRGRSADLVEQASARAGLPPTILVQRALAPLIGTSPVIGGIPFGPVTFRDVASLTSVRTGIVGGPRPRARKALEDFLGRRAFGPLLFQQLAEGSLPPTEFVYNKQGRPIQPKQRKSGGE